MRLRSRMAVVAGLVALPQVIGLVWWDGVSRHQAAEAVLTGLLERVLAEPDAAEACAASPDAWTRRMDAPRGPRHHRPPGDRPPPGPPRGPQVRPPTLEVHAIDAVPAALAGVPEDAVAAFGSPFSAEVAVATRTGWGGACEVAVVRGSTAPGFLGSVLPASPLWVAPMVLVATVMWLAVGPPVRRLRALTENVRTGRHPVSMDGSDEISELSRAFDAASGALRAEVHAREEREAALRDFVANTTHDVRIPLTVLRGHLVALESGSDRAALEGAVREAHYIGTLLDDLAAEARMRDVQPAGAVDLGAVVERVVARHAPIARRSFVELVHAVPADPLTVDADMTLVEQAVSNLVYNAIRHNRAGGHVAVVLEAQTGAFTLEVLDDGPGVEPEALARLTERGFVGPGSRNRDSAGEGLGLHIVARVASRHGWSFHLENRDDGGLLARLSGAFRNPQDLHG
ncbi:MAG: HAMP domain-containing sensor histidine kinase [Myxococcota bacterium]